MGRNRTNFKILKALHLMSFFLFSLWGCGQKGVSGHVIDPEGKPIDEVIVKVEKSSFESKTDKEGRYIIDYAPGSFKIVFSKHNYTTYELELNLSNKTLFPAESVTLYPVYKQYELYDIKNKKTYERLSPKDEWEIISKSNKLIGISNGNIKLTKELLSSLIPMSIDEISDEYLNSMQTELLMDIKILEIGKIVDIHNYGSGILVKVSAKAKQNEISGFIEIEMAKIGDNWFMKHVSYLL